MKKLWSGRFNAATALSVEEFTESISFDQRLWRYDIEGSIAHTKMLAHQGIISHKDAEDIIEGLNSIARDIETGAFVFKQELEDIHMNIESALIHRIGDVGGKVHTARSRNDQVALDLRLYLRHETSLIINLLKDLQDVLIDIAKIHTRTIMPGYTHLQRAQPVTLAHYMLAYLEMFKRDIERLRDVYKRINTMPLGACALAGTTLNTDRAYTAELLGFDRISENSIDAVSDRDFVIEFISDVSIIMMHLSRMAEELILWATEEFSFIKLSDAFTTGSSIMPQKKNPDVLELIRGKTGKIYGALINILTTMKGLPLAYNRDMQEDKTPLFEVIDTIKAVLSILTELLGSVTFNVERLLNTAGSGYSLATDLAEYLVKKGIPFRNAHEITGRVVRYCIDNNAELESLSLDIYKEFSSVIGEDIYHKLTLSASVTARTSLGGTSPTEVERQIKNFLRDYRNKI
ncbi:MAG: argininosuccinate lyase [Nitrospirae bacterium]|nr:argininosuccinate lyase [Nitrospirota bacterium]MBF0541450.1 argininosuccinate lyase [Nitrospirota bacterium]